MSVSRVSVTCPECKVLFYPLATEVKRGGGKVCSRKCYYLYLPKKLDSKNSDMKMSYAGVHVWIKRKKGVPSFCESCGSTTAKKFEWANLSGEYRRDLSDWKRLCTKCHMELDDHPQKRKETLMKRYGTVDYIQRNQKGQFKS